MMAEKYKNRNKDEILKFRPIEPIFRSFDAKESSLERNASEDSRDSILNHYNDSLLIYKKSLKVQNQNKRCSDNQKEGAKDFSEAKPEIKKQTS